MKPGAPHFSRETPLTYLFHRRDARDATRRRGAGLPPAAYISICRNRRKPRKFLVLVLVLVLETDPIEDDDENENENEDDSVAVPPRDERPGLDD